MVVALVGASRASVADYEPVPKNEEPEPSDPASTAPAPARVSLGAHFGLGELSFHVDRSSFWGRSYPVQAWIGFSFSNDLVLFGEFYDAHVFNPSSSYAEVTSLDLLGAGLGGKYYLTPARIYLSLSLLLSRVRFESDVTSASWLWGGATEERTHGGGIGRLAVGKDWQISRGWRLGLEGDVLLGWMGFKWSYDDDEHTGRVKGFSLAGSASYGYDVLPEVPTIGTGDARRRSIYVEARGGVGYLWTRWGVDSTSGPSYPFGASLGWTVGRRAVFLADVAYARLQPLTAGVYPDLRAGNFYAAGPRMKYYLTQSGLFLSGALLVSRIDFDHADASDLSSTHWGGAGEVSLGQEWRFADTWGLGIAAHAMLAPMSAGQDGMHLTKALSLLAFASFNYPKLTDESVESLATEGSRDSVADGPGAAADAASAGRHTHDGVYVGARLGVGWLSVDSTYSDFSFSGWGRPFALSLGYAVARSLVVFGEFYQLQVRHPSDPYDYLVDLELVGVGPGLTYYVPGINAFASFSASVSQVSYRNRDPLDFRYGTNTTSNWGVTGRLTLGKEWWVSSNWGLGLAGEVLLGRMGRAGDSSTPFHFTAKGYALLATASFN
jgi:hypothetical protein